ncbi:MAG: dienelactone hydrolase family protein [Bacteroidales bacterium]|nr:dienelactone hydrolase family protein [Bacteroidales bacterium]
MKPRLFVLILMLISASFRIYAQDIYTPEVGKCVRPKIKTLAKEQRGGYECRYIEFSTEEEERIKAYLLVPDKASWAEKCPAVLMLHDHGARFDIGKEKLVRPVSSALPDGQDDHIVKSSRQWIDKNFDGVYMADSLSSLGYVVLVADALYWGERSVDDAQRWSELNYGVSSVGKMSPKESKEAIKTLKTKVYDGQKTLYDSLYDCGIIWAEKMLRDDIASVHLLRRLPYVDKGNIGAFGFSMGAHRCWMLAAFCEEVRCGVALSWMTSLDREERMKPSDYSMAVMPMRERMDFGDIGLFLAPKPMLFLNGSEDHLFPKEKVEAAFLKLQGHYSEYNASSGSNSTEPAFEPLQTVFFKGGHHCGKDVQDLIVHFFDEYLD